jgi:FdhD protein
MRSVPIPVAETTWILVVNGDRIAHGMASPGRGRELAAGLMLSDGFIASRDDVLALDVREDRLATILDARVPEGTFAAAKAAMQHREEHGCGLLHYVACDTAALAVPRHRDVPDDHVLAEALRQLFNVCSSSFPGGGVHAAAMIGPSGADYTAIDVSRHAAVEKAAGAAILDGADTSTCGIVLTARISGPIALTAARSGVGWIASRSIPTTLALAIGAVAGLTVVARAGTREVHTFVPGAGSDQQ